MRLPGFEAETALYRVSGHYRMTAGPAHSEGVRLSAGNTGGQILPALAGPGNWRYCAYNCRYACEQNLRACVGCIEECLRVSPVD